MWSSHNYGKSVAARGHVLSRFWNDFNGWYDHFPARLLSGLQLTWWWLGMGLPSWQFMTQSRSPGVNSSFLCFFRKFLYDAILFANLSKKNKVAEWDPHPSTPAFRAHVAVGAVETTIATSGFPEPRAWAAPEPATWSKYKQVGMVWIKTFGLKSNDT